MGIFEALYQQLDGFPEDDLEAQSKPVLLAIIALQWKSWRACLSYSHKSVASTRSRVSTSSMD
jgi:hypothetical protein